MIFSSLQSYLILGLSAVITVGAAGGTFYIKHLKGKVEDLETVNIELSVENSRLETTVETLKQNAIDQSARNSELEKELTITRVRQNELFQVLQSHDLTALAKAKPGLIERRINDGTQKVFDDIESLSRTDRN